MTKLFQLSGFVGIVLVLFGAVAYVFPPQDLDPFVLVHLVAGGLLLLLFLSTQGMTVLRALRRRSTRYGLHSVSYTVFFIVILVLLNFLSSRYYLRWDLTESGVFSLSPQSVKVVKGLQQELEIYGFFDAGENSKLVDLIASYRYYSPQIKFELVDPSRYPDMARRFHIQEPDTLYLRYGNASANLQNPTEGSITNAILKLTGRAKEKIYFVTGHGEPSLTDSQHDQGFAAARHALENSNYQVEDLLLSSKEAVPPDASLVLIAGPEKPLMKPETAALENYLENGGRVLVLLPPPNNNSLNGLLRKWGVKVGSDIVVDQVIRLFSGPSLGIQPIVENYDPAHPVTQGFDKRTIFPMARSVEPVAADTDDTQVVSLAKTSGASWAETDVDTIFTQGKASLDKDDPKGPISVAVGVTAKTPHGGGNDAKLVVVGSSTFANNKFLQVFFNRDLFLNMANWLVGDERILSIHPRSIRASRLQLTEKESSTIFYLSFLILPEILLIAGLTVWWNRR